MGERIRKWIQRWFGRDEIAVLELKIRELEGRLTATHARMREMYWEEKAKEHALARIAWLEDEIRFICSELEVPLAYAHLTAEEFLRFRRGEIIDDEERLAKAVPLAGAGEADLS